MVSDNNILAGRMPLRIAIITLVIFLVGGGASASSYNPSQVGICSYGGSGSWSVDSTQFTTAPYGLRLFGNCNGGPEGSLANYLYSVSGNLDIQGSEINLDADEKIFLSGYPGYDVDDWGNIGLKVITNGIEYQLKYGLWYSTGGNPRTDKFISGFHGPNIYFFNIYSSYTDQTWNKISRNIRADLTSIGVSVGPTIKVTGISYDIRPSSYSTISVNGAWDNVVIKSDGVIRLLQNINHSTFFVGIGDIFANHFSNPPSRSNLFSICAIAF